MYAGPKYIDDFDATQVDTAVPVYVSIIGLFACLVFFRYFINLLKEVKRNEELEDSL